MARWPLCSNGGMPPENLPELVHQVRGSTARFLLALDELPPEMDRPTLLPGWSAGHLLTHIARNADALVRALDGARAGVPTAMYPGGTAARDAEIEAGAGRTLPEIAADLRESALRLDERWRAMEPATWDGTVITRQGERPAWRTVPGRWNEVELHWVDLDAGYQPHQWPHGYVTSLLAATTGPALATRLPAGVALRLHAPDLHQEWQAGGAGATTVVHVSGAGSALACWLAGRAAPVRAVLSVAGAAELPDLTPWL